ncbi:MAG: MiaB/RimO family radical SAM methylthiotransferase [Paludibacteraceae bacterium]|nr:MiaB/RimO family radical SAM methylthiotransferase [Paludibacteraceae bacterium]
MKIRFVTLGCKLNFAESSATGKALLEQGHTRAKQGEEADICVINTCSVTDNADHKDRQAIHRIHRQNPNAIIIVTGCYAQLQPEQIAQIEGVDYVLGQNEKYEIPALVERLESDAARAAIGRSQGELLAIGYRREAKGERICVGAIREVEEFHGAYSKDDRTRCFLKVQDGCNYFCTYCTIPYARGKSRNPKIADVVIAAQQALAEGAKELVLTGVNIGDFGRSTGETFLELLRALDRLEDGVPPIGRSQSELQVKGERLEAKGMDYRIRISSCEPNLLTNEIIDFVAHSKHFAPHFHIPLQSGSNEVLKIMKRRYTRELFEERVKHIKQVMPHAFIGVDCMVGVRGETEECFNDYVEFIKRLDVSQLHVFTYSERANTRMLELDLCIVPKTERQRRSKILHEISEEKTKTFYAQQIGREAVVLWESKKEGDQMAGFTENYVKIHRPYDKAKVNTFEVVRL